MKGYKIFGCEGIHRKFYEYELQRENYYPPLSFEEMNDVIKLNPFQANTLSTFGVVYLPFTSKEWANRYEIVIVNDYLCSALPEVFGNNEYYSGNVYYADNNKGHTKVLDRTAEMIKAFFLDDTAMFITYCCNPLRTKEEIEFINRFLNKADERVEKIKSFYDDLYQGNNLIQGVAQMVRYTEYATRDAYEIYHWTVCGVKAIIPFLIKNEIKYKETRRCGESLIVVKHFEIYFDTHKGNYEVRDLNINFRKLSWSEREEYYEVRTPSLEKVEKVISEIWHENVSDLKIFKEAV